MHLQLFRNAPKGSAITGRLFINNHYFCNTLERMGYQIPALCYHVIVTQSPKFKRLLPLVTGVPRLPIGGTPSNSEASDRAKPVQYPAAVCRTGIRFHRGSKPEHSTGCILVVADNPSRARELIGAEVVENNVVEVVDHSDPCRSRDIDSSGTLSKLSSNNNSSLSSNKKNIGSRSAADIESQFTQLLLQTQESHEEIILEVIDFRPGTDYGYDTPCPPELQKP